MTYEMYHVLFKMALRRVNNNAALNTEDECFRYRRNSQWLRRIDQYWLEQWALEDAVYTYQTTIECPYE